MKQNVGPILHFHIFYFHTEAYVDVNSCENIPSGGLILYDEKH